MTTPKNRFKQPIDRRKIYAKLAILKKQHGLDEETYRDFLAKHGATEKDGRISATTMSGTQLMQALDALNGKTAPSMKFRVFGGGEEKSPHPREEQLKCLVAVWRDLYRLGVLEKCGSEQYAVDVAIDRWAKSEYRIDKIDFLPTKTLNVAINRLKAWYEREINRRRGESVGGTGNPVSEPVRASRRVGRRN